MNATKLYLHPIFQTQPGVPVLIKYHTLPNTQQQERRIEQLQDAIRCAAEWLRQGASGRALEVLEDNL